VRERNDKYVGFEEKVENKQNFKAILITGKIYNYYRNGVNICIPFSQI